MTVLIMAGAASLRTAVARRLASELGWSEIHLSDDEGSPSDRTASLRAQLSAAKSAARPVVYSAPIMSLAEYSALQSLARIDWVLLKRESDQPPRYPAVLTLDGDMTPDVLVATIRAVLRLPLAPRENR